MRRARVMAPILVCWTVAACNPIYHPRGSPDPDRAAAFGLEPVAYAHPSLEPALAETLGVIVFQEQVLRVAMAVAGFTPAQADHLRRAMNRGRPDDVREVRDGDW